MTLVVPAVLGGLAIVVVALVSMAASRRQREGSSEPAYMPAILVHAINDDRCTGCDACVAVCPTNVLDLVDNKSRVLRFQDCIQCEACMWACPTEALVMFKEGTEPPPLTMPELDQYYQTAIPGQYLIGEVAGKPLVKNAANLGRAVVEHMLSTGLRPSMGQMVNIVIVGSGPGGLSAALTCIERGLSYLVLEKEQIIASTIARYPKGKLIMAEPYDTRNLSLLPVFDSSKEELLPIWKELLERAGVKINLGEAVEEVQHLDNGFGIRTTVGQYRAQRVILATGTRGKPRTLGVPGENLSKVYSLLEDPDEHRGRAVLVVGGGDSALEATIALADAGAKVILSYRGRSFARAQPKLKSTVEGYDKQRRIKIKYQSVVTEFAEDTVTLQMANGSLKKYPNEAAFVLIGSEPPVKWLKKVGVNFVERPHSYALPKSDELVMNMLGDRARDCPETAKLAAALVQGRDVPIDSAPLGQPKTGRKWLRSATSLFGGKGRKLDKPMPLGEFARSRRSHTGSGRRDQLAASERTRVLRMLRDEGARLADEESSVELFRPPTGQVEWAEDARQIAPTRTNSDSMPAPIEDEKQPKQAVIVGLAQAAARGPRGTRKRRSSGPPNEGDPAQEPPASSRKQPRGDTHDLLNSLIEQDRRSKRASGSPPPFSEQATRVVGLDPERFMAEAEADAGGHRQARPDEPTEDIDFEQMIAEEAAPARRVFTDSVKLHSPEGPSTGSSDIYASSNEATQTVDIERLANLEHKRAGSGDADDVDEAPTRQLDLGPERLQSLSDIDFDLDYRLHYRGAA